MARRGKTSTSLSFSYCTAAPAFTVLPSVEGADSDDVDTSSSPLQWHYIR